MGSETSQLDPALLARVIAPPLATAALPGVGGALRSAPEDFEVRELPAYGADDREGAHLLLTMRKRGLTTDEAVAALTRALELGRGEIGVAGLKDKHAITEQWITVPWSARDKLAAFDHPEITLGEARPHGNKLRRGHLRGNHFTIVLRDLTVPLAEAHARAQAKLAAIAEAGLENLFGAQRFGHDGQNAARGLALLRDPAAARRRRTADIVLSAGQSAIFNLLVLTRRERGLSRTVLAGDILKKTETGGLFECAEPEVDQARLDAGELAITGPIFGSKTRAPSPGTAAAALEAAALEALELDPSALLRLGRKLPGTRRVTHVRPAGVELATVEDERGAGLKISFALPAGSYATQLLRELCGPT